MLGGVQGGHRTPTFSLGDQFNPTRFSAHMLCTVPRTARSLWLRATPRIRAALGYREQHVWGLGTAYAQLG